MSIRKDLLEDESNADRWMISYADFITLLFALFVVMYAVSSVNDEKYRILSETLADAFETEATSEDPFQVGEPMLAASPHVVDVPDVDGWADPVAGNTEVTSDNETQDIEYTGFVDAEGISMQANNEWLEFTLQDELLFAPGSANLGEGAQAAIDLVRIHIEGNRNPVTIEGYTDNIPTEGQSYSSNWVLSAARASAVAQYLTTTGIRRERIAAVGYGENHPLATNATPEGRAQNRRVVIVVARRTDLARNRNTEAIVERARPSSEATIVRRRKPDGGLIFTKEE